MMLRFLVAIVRGRFRHSATVYRCSTFYSCVLRFYSIQRLRILDPSCVLDLFGHVIHGLGLESMCCSREELRYISRRLTSLIGDTRFAPLEFT